MKIERGAHSVNIEHVLSVASSEDQQELKSEKLFAFTINAGAVPDLK